MSTENEGAGKPTEPADGRPADGAAPGAPETPPPAAAGPPTQADYGPPPADPVPPPGPPSAAPPQTSPAQAGSAGTGPASGQPLAPSAGFQSPYSSFAGGVPPAGGAWGALSAPPPARKRRGGWIAAIAAVTLVAGGLGGGIGYFAAESSDSANPTAVSETNGQPAADQSAPESVAGIADAALPSVVTIQADGGGEGSTGTGFVYDEAGHIMTNNHVVAGAAGKNRLTATFSDGESYEAEIVGQAEGYDVAVIKLRNADDRELKPLPMGDSDAVTVGDATIAIGAPYGLSGTVTTGIISAKDRPVASNDGQGGTPSYMSALQTDASINPGNSGGPLLDASGSVIGVNSAIRSNSDALGGSVGSVGLGFAIPVSQAQRVAEDLIETGEPVYAVIGISVDMSAGGSEGAAVSDKGADGESPVVAGGPAEQAGLRPGDVIVRFGDRVIDSGPTLISEIWTYEVGSEVELTYLRDGRESTTTVTLDERVGD